MLTHLRKHWHLLGTVTTISAVIGSQFHFLWANVSGQHTRRRPAWIGIIPFLPFSGGFGRTRRRAPAAGWCPCQWLSEGSLTRSWQSSAASSSAMLTHHQWSPSAEEGRREREREKLRIVNLHLTYITCSSERALTQSSPHWQTWWGKWSRWCVWSCCMGGEREREVRGTSGSTCGLNKDMVWPWGTRAEFSSEFNLREAWDSLQDDIELSSLAGTNGDTCCL